jgi:DNA invertase Pin-like site-specific DNA recombinase
MFEVGRAQQDLRSIEAFTAQIVEAAIADFRSHQICPRVLPESQEEDRRAPKKTGNVNHRRLFTPEEVQKILYLKSSELLTSAAIARRFGTSASEIYRVLKRYEDSSKKSQARLSLKESPCHGKTPAYCLSMPGPGVPGVRN